MAKTFEFNSMEELINKIEQKDLNLSMEIFTQIKKAFNKKKKRIIAFTALITPQYSDIEEYIEFSIDRDQWPISLNTCLQVFSENDMFEECIEVRDILKVLENESK